MKKEKTLAVILPSCTRYAARIEGLFEDAGLNILKSAKEVQFSHEQAEEFFGNKAEELVEVFSKFPVNVYCLSGKNAIDRLQDLLGPEDPGDSKAKWSYQLRCRFADGVAYANGNPDNGFYGSESDEEVSRQFKVVFGPRGVVNNK